MHNATIRILGLVFFLSLGSLALSAALPELPDPLATPAAFAQSVPDGLSKLEQKANDVQVLVRKVLYVFVGIGIAFCGFRFIQGDPHAWRHTMTMIIGATIIFAAAEILAWLER